MKLRLLGGFIGIRPCYGGPRVVLPMRGWYDIPRFIWWFAGYWWTWHDDVWIEEGDGWLDDDEPEQQR